MSDKVEAETPTLNDAKNSSISIPEKQEIKEQLADFLREHYSLQMDELEGLTAIIRQWLIKKKKLNNDSKGKTKTSFNRLLNKTLDIANSQIDELIKELDKEIKL